jgi:exopolysaccharide biosynthesis polyprenyl glycosylphosphotransferase
MLILIPTIVLLSSTLRAGVRAGLHRVEPLNQRAVIVGSGLVAGIIVEKLQAHRQFGLVAVGSVDDDPPEVSNLHLPRLGTLSDLPGVLRFHEIDRVIIAFSRSGHEQLLRCIRVCRDQGVVVDVVPRLFEFLDGARSLDYVGGLPVLTIGTPRLNRSSQVAKRALDAALASLFLVALAPLLALVAAAIKLESPGPVVFRQPRVGRGGKVFGILKFRSMYADAELRKPELADSNGESVLFKLREDPRITRVGRILRRFSIDELPQLVNVVRGHMSLVGPRPLINPEIEAMDEEWHVRRLDLRPGMTGPWQVTGRSESPFEEMVRLDYQYVAGWSLARDVEILLATIPAVLSGRGAY